MMKVIVFVLLFALYAGYSILVYTKGTQSKLVYSPAEQTQIAKGKALYQQYNCSSCHQLYGLGGYLGPELTTAWSDKNRGEAYIKALLKSGGARMPNFHFSDEDIEAITNYLKYVDATAVTYKQSN